MKLALFLALAVLPPVPLAGPADVIRPFDPPPLPYAAGHRGVDLHAEPGDPIAAPLPGVVSFAGPVARVGWVSVDHGGGLVTTYGPLEPRAVVAGQRVTSGDVLGWLDLAEDAHLNWGARLHGSYLDPLLLLVPWEPYLVAGLAS